MASTIKLLEVAVYPHTDFSAIMVNIAALTLIALTAYIFYRFYWQRLEKEEAEQSLLEKKIDKDPIRSLAILKRHPNPDRIANKIGEKFLHMFYGNESPQKVYGYLITVGLVKVWTRPIDGKEYELYTIIRQEMNRRFDLKKGINRGILIRWIEESKTPRSESIWDDINLATVMRLPERIIRKKDDLIAPDNSREIITAG